MPSNKLYSIAQAAKGLGVARQTVHAAIIQKRLKAKRGTFEVERIVKTKMRGWVIDEANLRAYQVSEQHREAGKKNVVAAREKKRRNPHKTVILTMLLFHGATTYAGQGWYHIIPPTEAWLNAPIREWTQLGAYDTAKACEAERLDLVKHVRQQREKGSIPPSQYAQIASGICIASDDPRLSK